MRNSSGPRRDIMIIIFAYTVFDDVESTGHISGHPSGQQVRLLVASGQ